MRTPKLMGLNDRLAGMISSVETAADRMHKRIAKVEDMSSDGIAKINTVVDSVEAIAKDIHDAANQMTNGAPPLSDSNSSPDGQKG